MRRFWSLYGKLAWDQVKAPRKEQLRKCIVRALCDQQPLRERKLLDAGCGTGDYALALAKAGFEVTAIDYAEGMLARAKDKTPADVKIVFQRMDLNRSMLFADATFDCVISIGVLFAVADPIFTLREMLRVLKPGGKCLLTHAPRNPNPLLTVIRNRFRMLQQKRPDRIALVIIKALLERTPGTRFWEIEELLAMFLKAGYIRPSVNPGPPIIIQATKPGASAAQISRTGEVDATGCQRVWI